MAAAYYYFIIYNDGVVVSADSTLYEALPSVNPDTPYLPGDELTITRSGNKILITTRANEPRPSIYVYYANKYYFVAGTLSSAAAETEVEITGFTPYIPVVPYLDKLTLSVSGVAGTYELHDARVAEIDNTPTANSTNLVTSGGVKTYVDNAVPASSGVTDVTLNDVSIVTDGVAELEAESVSAMDLETPVETSYPSGGFRPNKIYDLGSQTGSKTYALYTTGLDTTVKNEWVWSFTTGSTAPSITWPSPSGMKWDGGSAPTINSNCLYEISIRLIGSYYVGYYKEIEL